MASPALGFQSVLTDLVPAQSIRQAVGASSTTSPFTCGYYPLRTVPSSHRSRTTSRHVQVRKPPSTPAPRPPFVVCSRAHNSHSAGRGNPNHNPGSSSSSGGGGGGGDGWDQNMEDNEETPHHHHDGQEHLNDHHHKHQYGAADTAAEQDTAENNNDDRNLYRGGVDGFIHGSDFYNTSRDNPDVATDPPTPILPSASPENFTRVRVFSLGPPNPATSATLLTLLPEDPTDGDGFRTAFRMSISTHQAKAIRDMLLDRDAYAAGKSTTPRKASVVAQASTSNSNSHKRTRGEKKSKSSKPSASRKAAPDSKQDKTLHDSRGHTENELHQQKPRPTTHALFNSLLNAQGGIIAEAAITHIMSDVFIASIYLHLNDTNSSQRTIVLDARPSDAIAIAAQANAPLYLHRDLLRQWPVSVAAIQLDAAAGLCECIPPLLPLQEISTFHPTFTDPTGDIFAKHSRYQQSNKRHSDPSARDSSNARPVNYVAADWDGQVDRGAPSRRAPEFERLLNLYAYLDVAIRCERFKEAAQLRDEIDKICPLERLRESLKEAVKQQRFLDAASLRDEITRWEVTMERWETPGNMFLDWSKGSPTDWPTVWDKDQCDGHTEWDIRDGFPAFPGRLWTGYEMPFDVDYLDASFTDSNETEDANGSDGSNGMDMPEDTEPTVS